MLATFLPIIYWPYVDVCQKECVEYVEKQLLFPFHESRVIPGTPNNGTPYGKLPI